MTVFHCQLPATSRQQVSASPPERRGAEDGDEGRHEVPHPLPPHQVGHLAGLVPNNYMMTLCLQRGGEESEEDSKEDPEQVISAGQQEEEEGVC